MLWLYYIIPVILRFLLLPLWYWEKNPGNASTLEMALGILVIPIYLIIVSAKSIRGVSMGKFIAYLLLMLLIAIVGDLTGYLNWGVSTGNLFTPDSATLLIVRWQIILSSIVVTLGWCIVCIVKRGKQS
jgi:hypothetical protein